MVPRAADRAARAGARTGRRRTDDAGAGVRHPLRLGGRPVASRVATAAFARRYAARSDFAICALLPRDDVLATIPPADEVHPSLAVVKVVGLSALLLEIGTAVYGVGARQNDEYEQANGDPDDGARCWTCRRRRLPRRPARCASTTTTRATTRKSASASIASSSSRCRGRAIPRSRSTRTNAREVFLRGHRRRERKSRVLRAASARFTASGRPPAEATEDQPDVFRVDAISRDRQAARGSS